MGLDCICHVNSKSSSTEMLKATYLVHVNIESRSHGTRLETGKEIKYVHEAGVPSF